MTPRVVGVDLSLTSTGLADNSGRMERIQTEPKGKGARPVAETLARLNVISTAVAGFVNDWVADEAGNWAAWNIADLVVVEGPSYGSTGGMAHTRGGLWWMAVDAINNGFAINDPPVPILVVTPGQRMIYACGSGRVTKDRVLAAAIKRYPAWDITGNDVADAVILAAIGARMLGHPIEGSLPKTHLRALDKLTLPET